MNVIFLDIDGVLKPFEDYYPEQGLGHNFEKSCVDCLNLALKEINVKIVICSMWRLDFDNPLVKLKEIFKDNWIEKEVFDLTPVINGFSKGKEIKKWLEANPNVNNYLVIDDDCFKEFFNEIPKNNKLAPDPLWGLEKHCIIKVKNHFKQLNGE